MFGFFKKPDPIELTVNLPSDGTYPPRIVFPGRTVWLRKQGDPFEIVKGVFVRNEGEHCVIVKLYGHVEININNQPLEGERRLEDGDLIHNTAIRCIFQADPVADYRAEWANVEAEKTTLEMTNRLVKNIIIDEDSITINGGTSRVKWIDLQAVYMYSIMGRWELGIRWTQQEISGDLPEALNRTTGLSLRNEEAITVFTWILYMAPFRPSFDTRGQHYHDAYTYLAHTRLIEPADDAGNELPASRAFIMNLTPPLPVFMRLLANLGLAVFFGVCTAWIFTGLPDVVGFLIGFLVIIASLFQNIRAEISYLIKYRNDDF